MIITSEKTGRSATIFNSDGDNDYEAFNQIERFLTSPVSENTTVRVMPDYHYGIGCTVGTTILTRDRVSPSLVSGDIGCNIYVLYLGKIPYPKLKKLDEIIHNKIPSGFKTRDTLYPRHASAIQNLLSDLTCKNQIPDLKRCGLSCGSLGSGNHFIELAKSKDGETYLLVHSGSRKLGQDVHNIYRNLAMKKNPGIAGDLAWLEGEDLQDYIHDTLLCQEFAIYNTSSIADSISNEMKWNPVSEFYSVHNFVEPRDDGSYIIRKGATPVYAGQLLVIPLNMRDGSLICHGKGNPDWNYSAPHGAGRRMSRAKAKSLSIDKFKIQMKGIYSTSISSETLDESPMAYKKPDSVLSMISPTVDIVKRIFPIYNFKPGV